MRRTSRLVAAGATLATVAAIAPAASAATRPHFSPGAPGIGDPYFPLEGNGGYDALHYGLDLKYDPSTKRLDGVVTMTARATQNLSRFDLDLQQLTVAKVAVNGRKAKFTRKGQELVITPKSGLRKNTRFTVSVTYGGVPQTIVGSPVVFGSPYGFVHTDDGAFMGDEPNAASTWFPSNDHPSDKAAFTFKVTVPKDLGVIANGRLVSKRTKGTETTFVWDEKAPMATYLATADIGKWDFKFGGTPGGTKEIVAVDPKLKGRDPDHPDPMAFFWDTTGEATDLWSKMYGGFPFDSTGAIGDLATYNGQPIGFSLETQTRPLYSDVRSTNTIAHELAHQWFGDSVSVKTWNNVWLNESFATFCQQYWAEKHGGATVHDAARNTYNRHAADDSWWNVVIADPKRDTMFHNRVYSGGAMVLEFLRERIGDEKFFTLLRDWAVQHRYGNATTEQFTALAQKISGQDLSGFFTTWLYSPGKPDLPEG
ncbi:MAG: M1 family metallopeptidase [Actinoallomurus sp.]